MELKYNVTGSDRKRLVSSIAKIAGSKSKYLGMPSMAYEVGCFTIDKNGTVSFDDTAGTEIKAPLSKLGFDAEPVEMCTASDSGWVNPWDRLRDEEIEPPANGTPEEVPGLEITIPRSVAPDTAIQNLARMLHAKGSLIKKATGADNTYLVVKDTVLRFPWFDTVPSPEVVDATSLLIGKMLATAKAKKRIVIKANEEAPENEKYAFRCYLLSLGFIGAEYKKERKILLHNLSGSSAFKGGAHDAVSE